MLSLLVILKYIDIYHGHYIFQHTNFIYFKFSQSLMLSIKIIQRLLQQWIEHKDKKLILQVLLYGKLM